MGSSFLGDWSYAQIHQECGLAYGKYRAGLDARYKAYFEANPGRAGTHPQLAATFELALPPGMEGLATRIPPRLRHRHHLSGKSSQSLGLGILGTATHAAPDLLWFEEQLSPVAPFSVATPPVVAFEHELDPGVLGEHPRVTAVDFLVETDDAVICTESKWAEEGLGRCSCGAVQATVGDCTKRVLGRSAYWQAAREIFFLPERKPGHPCPISAGYQAIRNVAAAAALAGISKEPVFVLLYDENNPYFRQTSDWPGWPTVLRATLATADSNGLLKFRAISWQQLVPALPLPKAVAQWTVEKHGLG